MIQVIAKTLMRALLIFLPVAFLSLHKETSTGQPTVLLYIGIALFVLLLLSVLVMGWIRKNSKHRRITATKTIPSVVRQDR